MKASFFYFMPSSAINKARGRKLAVFGFIKSGGPD